MLSVFIRRPLLALVPAALLLALGVWSRSRIAAIAGGLWLLYAAYELGMKARVLCTGECNIRVDLLAIYPVLIILSAVGLVGVVRSRRAVR